MARKKKTAKKKTAARGRKAPVVPKKPRKKYIIKEGAPYNKKDAVKIGRALDSVREQYGRLTSEFVVKAATKSNHPLHKYFEWDDTEAAESWRQEQARQLIKSIKITIVREDNDEPLNVRAFVSIRTDEGREYAPVMEAMSNRAHRSQLLADALDDLKMWRKRYKDLQELAGLFAAIDAAMESKTLKKAVA